MNDKIGDWIPVIATTLGAIAGMFIAIITQWITLWREHHNRLDHLKLELYLEVIRVVMDNEEELAKMEAKACIPPVEEQKKRFSVLHRLTLLGSNDVRDEYTNYLRLHANQTQNPITFRESSTAPLTESRNRLIKLMRKDVRREFLPCRILS